MVGSVEILRGRPSLSVFPAQASAELAEFRVQLPAGDATALGDFNNAERLDRSHRETFAADIERVDHWRKQIATMRDILLDTVTRVGLFVAQTLTFANGAVALAALGYMGKDGGASISVGLIWVLVLSSVGFLLTFLSGHIATLRAQPFLKLLSDLSQPWLPEADRLTKAEHIPGASRKAILPTRYLAYAAAGCLI